MFYNLHDDIGNDIFEHKRDKANRLDDYHYPKFIKGKIKRSAIVCFFLGDENYDIMQEMIAYVYDQINKSQYFSFENDKKIQVFIAVEGMCPIDCDIKNRIKWLKQHKVKTASLVWNDNNKLACGAKSGNMPLSDLGIDAVKYLNEYDITIDISHLCEQGVYDVLKYSSKPIIATHSNAYEMCNHFRNLSDDLLIKIKEQNGIIGVVGVKSFVSNDHNLCNIKGLLLMIDYLKNLIGENNLAFGFDFMDYFGKENSMIEGLKSCCECDELLTVLNDKYDNDFVSKICYQNVIDFFER